MTYESNNSQVVIVYLWLNTSFIIGLMGGFK